MKISGGWPVKRLQLGEGPMKTPVGSVLQTMSLVASARVRKRRSLSRSASSRRFWAVISVSVPPTA